ncbi:Cytidine deaminase, putative [Pediculus humanus corporis]|uniref:Cytidine deaminase n=1 Tax=Pediculus humanus subsp. corporis TaxID=121224 RepID=E0VKR4_PEDHC|nr:Cytidine deaminase, putative [Pediculus humanus corporis]EEB13970.1 Cytidine deaminase, putative [Pediculus humanus corporis]
MDQATSTSLGKLIPFEQTSASVQNLLQLSCVARNHAYAPYSKFAVGAALLCRDGEIFQGCNVENSSYGLSVCAEQTAIVKAISSGNRNISAIAVVADSNSFVTTPCGKCRQFINEFGTQIDVYCAKTDLKEVLLSNISNLLPYSFHIMR